MITDPSCKHSSSYLMLKLLCILCLFLILRLSVRSQGIFALRMYIVVASSHPWDQGVTTSVEEESNFDWSF